MIQPNVGQPTKRFPVRPHRTRRVVTAVLAAAMLSMGGCSNSDDNGQRSRSEATSAPRRSNDDRPAAAPASTAAPTTSDLAATDTPSAASELGDRMGVDDPPTGLAAAALTVDDLPRRWRTTGPEPVTEFGEGILGPLCPAGEIVRLDEPVLDLLYARHGGLRTLLASIHRLGSGVMAAWVVGVGWSCRSGGGRVGPR